MTDRNAAERAAWQLATTLAGVIRDRLSAMELDEMLVASYLRQPLSTTTRKLDGLEPWTTLELCRIAGLLDTTPAELLQAAENR